MGNKTNYVSLGIKLTKIHRVLRFKQSDRIKEYIGFSTPKKRMNTANSFKKDCFKLMINSVYGQTMENVRLVTIERDFLKYTNKPTYITHKIFNKDHAAIHEIKPVLTLKKPIYVGFTVL